MEEQSIQIKIEQGSVKHQQHVKYAHISYTLRRQLIKEVQKNGLSIYRASQILGIKNCTAKAILRQYRQAGHIFKRKHEKKRICVRELEPKHQLKETPSAEKVQQEKKTQQRDKQEQIVYREAPSFGTFPFFPQYYPYVHPNLLIMYGWQ